MLQMMPYYYATHNTQLAVHSPRSALSGVFFVSPVLPVERLLTGQRSADVSLASVSAPDSDLR